MWRLIPLLLLQIAAGHEGLRTPAESGPGAQPSACTAWARTEFPNRRVFWVDPWAAGARNDGAGSASQPWNSLHAARRNDLRSGDVIIVARGLYREAIHPKASGLTITGCPGEEVIISGADLLQADWEREGNAWRAMRFSAGAGGAVFGDRYDATLFVADGALLIPAENASDLKPGGYTITSDHGLLVRLPGDADPRRARMEVGARAVLFDPPGLATCANKSAVAPGVILRHITFIHASNPAQTGAVCLAGIGGLVEDVTIRDTNGRGLEVWGSGHSVRRTEANGNGHLGLGGGCQGCLLEDVTADRNNWRNHDPYWEAGGAKWVYTSDTVFKRFMARDNDGPGLWFDGFSSGNRVETSTLIGNLVSGIQVELGSDNNQILGSAIVETRRDGWAGEGILIMASTGTRVERNVIAHNAGSGIWVRKDSRQPTGGAALIGNLIQDNATETTGWNFQIRVEMDAPEGGSMPRFELTGNRLITRDISQLAGVRHSRGEDVRRVLSTDALHEALRVQGPTFSQIAAARHPCKDTPGVAEACGLVADLVK